MNFSIVIPVMEKTAYLLPVTLDSISTQGASSYEVILVNGTKREIHAEKAKILKARSTHLFAMMNEGLAAAEGEYVHFMCPGEFYISNHVFSFVQKFIESYTKPDLVYAGAMIRERFVQPQVYLKQISLDELEKAKVPSSLQSFWLKKETLVGVGGLNAKYAFQGGLDLICRYYRSDKVRKAFMRRILTDYEYRRLLPKAAVQQFWETFTIVFKYFGPSFSLLPWLARNYLQLLRWWWKIIKSAFWKQNVIS